MAGCWDLRSPEKVIALPEVACNTGQEHRFPRCHPEGGIWETNQESEMSKNDGGPAFPIPGLQDDQDFNGMTLRDYFAAKALTALISVVLTDGAETHDGQPVSEETMAEQAYCFADAMIAAREA